MKKLTLVLVGAGLAYAAGPVQAQDVPPGENPNAPCEYVAGGKSTWDEWYRGQCLPKRCLTHCTSYASGILEGIVDGGEMVTVNLMHCALSCYLNDTDALPGASKPDLPCRRHTEWQADNPQNWLQHGQVCDAPGHRACLYGQCLDSSAFVLQALDGYFTSGTGEAWYLRAVAGAKRPSERKSWHREFGYTAQVLMSHTQLRPAGPLVRPDWKKVQRQDYERELVRRAKEQAEAEAGRRI